MSVKKHTHKYKRFDIGRKKDENGKRIPYVIYKCVLDCTHFIPAMDALSNKAMLNGRKTICWRCEEEFIVDWKAAWHVKPHCVKCRKSKSGEIVDVEKLVADDVESFMEKFR